MIHVISSLKGSLTWSIKDPYTSKISARTKLMFIHLPDYWRDFTFQVFKNVTSDRGRKN